MKLSIYFVCFLSSLAVYSQTVEPSSSVDKSILQFEFEASFATEKNNSERINYWSTPNTLVRYGLFKSLELNLSVPVTREHVYHESELEHSLHKFEDTQFGFTLNLWKQHKILPETALMSRVLIPHHKESNLEELVALNFSNQLSEKLVFNYNLGCVFGSNTPSIGYYVFNLSYNVNPKVHLFVEDFGNFGNDQSKTNAFNFGGGYNFNDNLALDFFLANGLNNSIFYSGFIFTWAFNTKK